MKTQKDIQPKNKNIGIVIVIAILAYLVTSAVIITKTTKEKEQLENIVIAQQELIMTQDDAITLYMELSTIYCDRLLSTNDAYREECTYWKSLYEQKKMNQQAYISTIQ